VTEVTSDIFANKYLLYY